MRGYVAMLTAVWLAAGSAAYAAEGVGLAGVVEKVLPTAVSVQATWPASEGQPPPIPPGFIGQPMPAFSRISQTTGTVASADGLVVTLLQSDARKAKYEITLQDGRRLPARLVVEDFRSNLCLLKIDAEDLAYVSPADEPARLGQEIATVYCGGDARPTVARGIVAADGKGVHTPADVWQTDLRVEPGSGGAPVVDLQGKLVGIVYLYREQRPTLPSLSVASPSGVATLPPAHTSLPPALPAATYVIPARYLDALLKQPLGEEVITLRPAWLGISMQNGEEGIDVREALPNSPAAAAELKPGDLIMTIDGQTVREVHEALNIITHRKPGDKVRITYRREGVEKEVEVTLAERPGDSHAQASEPSARLTVVYPEQYRIFGADGQPAIQPPGGPLPAVEASREMLNHNQPAVPKPGDQGPAIGFSPENLKFAQPVLPTPPVIQVIRPDAEKKIDELNAEVKKLRGQLDKLLEQVESLKVSPPKADKE